MISTTNMESIQKLQNKCVKKIDTNEKQVQNIYKRHNLLKVKDVLVLENCKMVYRLENNMLPTKLSKLYNANQKGKTLKKTHGYNTRNKMLPNLARTHCKEYNTSYLCSSLKDYQNMS